MSQYVLTQIADKTSVLRQGTPAPAHWFISTRVFSCVDPILMHILLYYSDLFHSGFAVTMCVKERRYSRGLAREEAGIPLLGQLSLHSMVRQNPEVFYGEFALAMCVKSNQRRLVKWVFMWRDGKHVKRLAGVSAAESRKSLTGTIALRYASK